MMGSTRQAPPFQIYQEYPAMPQQVQPPSNRHRPQLQPSAMPLQPNLNSQAYSDPNFHPPMSTPQQISPLKSTPMSPPDHMYNAMGYVPIPAPSQTAMYAGSPVKKGHAYPTHQYQHMRMAQPTMMTFNSNFEAYGSDNFAIPSSMPETLVDFPDPSFGRREPLKRSYSDVIHTYDRHIKKPKLEEETNTQLPEPEDMPPVEDEEGKPPYSYAQMIAMAILRAPHRRLTLAQIYDWISTTFKYYRDDPKQGWHNSIRHNLSLNKNFMKQERPKGDAGKGSYWLIKPGEEAQYVKDKSRKGNLGNVTMQQTMGRQTVQGLAAPLAEALAPKPWVIQPTPPPSTMPLPPRPQTAPASPDLSSDATVPASDPALEEDNAAECNAAMAPLPSSPPRVMNSSPPVVNGKHQRTASTPGLHSRSYNRPPKRGANAMDDSGYFSSLESSVRRADKTGVILTSEIDIGQPRKKRGRAEEEIARIRSSSHDVTPSHRRFSSMPSEHAQSSSPLHPSPPEKLNPMTPAAVFKKPMPPPQSISPNTQLRYHRAAMQQYIDSPIRNNGLWSFDAENYSPAFKTTGSLVPSGFEEHFQIYSDVNATYTPSTPMVDSSPLKMPAKRHSAVASQRGNSVLTDVSQRTHRLNAKTPSKISSKTPLLKPSGKISVAGSPLRNSTAAMNVPDYTEELFDFGSFADENSDVEGVDITKGFQRIGSNAAVNYSNTPNGNSRPTLGARSHTSLF